jgi:hypothetical protein
MKIDGVIGQRLLKGLRVHVPGTFVHRIGQHPHQSLFIRRIKRRAGITKGELKIDNRKRVVFPRPRPKSRRGLLRSEYLKTCHAPPRRRAPATANLDTAPHA